MVERKSDGLHPGMGKAPLHARKDFVSHPDLGITAQWVSTLLSHLSILNPLSLATTIMLGYMKQK